ncbi:MAG: hypothetical protein LC118_14090 [Dehalococcoidia bacterium]|nr:hypothetical protein [Dehalococcoidia bacterium]
MTTDQTNTPVFQDEEYARQVRSIADDLALEFARVRSEPDADPEAFLDHVRADLGRIYEVSGRDEAAAEGIRLFLDELTTEPI